MTTQLFGGWGGFGTRYKQPTTSVRYLGTSVNSRGGARREAGTLGTFRKEWGPVALAAATRRLTFHTLNR